MFHIDQSFKCEHSLILSSAFNGEKFMWQFLQYLSNGTVQNFPTYSVIMPF